jgi:hypothetical protein
MFPDYFATCSRKSLTNRHRQLGPSALVSELKRSKEDMHLERKDYRGIVIFLSVVAFCAAFGLADHTIDREPGERAGRRELVAGHTGDQKFWNYAGITASVGAALALLAMIRPLWESSPRKKESPAPKREAEK